MADSQLELNGMVPAARFTKVRADEPRFLLDELVERKLSILLAGETEPGHGLRRAEVGTLRTPLTTH